MRRLATKDLAIERLDPGWLIRLLSVITDPNVAFILLLVGIYGLIFEFSSPGAIAPGVIGTIALLLGLYALNMLPGCKWFYRLATGRERCPESFRTTINAVILKFSERSSHELK